MALRNLLLGTVAAIGVMSSAAYSEDVALVLGSDSYRNFADVEQGGLVLSTVDALTDAGFRVISARDATMSGLQNATAQLEKMLPDADRVVVVLSGAFLHNDAITWFAPTDLRSPSLAAVGFEGMSVQALMGYLGRKPGGAVLFLASDGTAGPGTLVSKGVGRIEVPQGVLVVQGTPRSITKIINNQFLVKGRSFADAVRLSKEDITAKGYLSALSSLNPAGGGVVGLSDEELKLLEESAYWKAVLDLGTIPGFNSYLRRYPRGEFVEGANARIQAIKDARPKYSPAEKAEIDLNLTRNDRSRVQEQLSFLGFDTRGIDGLFGPATRGALRRWQVQNGVEATGYLTAQDMQKLRLQAEKRARRLAREAEQREIERQAADAAFWQATGANGREADFLAYLGRYPEGLYADAAQKGLRVIERRKRKKSQAAETSKWDVATKADSKIAYEEYLNAYPNGAFVAQARSRIAEIEKQQARNAIVQAAKAEEEKLPLNAGMLLILEKQLKKLKLGPGDVDGKMTPDTRKALRRYQRSRGLEVSGYLTRSTIVQLMAE